MNAIKWDTLTKEEQELYILINNIKVCYTHSIADTLECGFGNLSELGFWEYTLKGVGGL